MGFWDKAVTTVGDVLTLGGNSRGRKWLALRTSLYQLYEKLIRDLEAGNVAFHARIASLQMRLEVCGKRIRKCERILNPLRGYVAPDGSVAAPLPSVLHGREMGSPLPRTDLRFGSGVSHAVLVGAGTGAASTVAAWGAVQLVGHASTGTAMAGLHGAAAANAGWAWFGGGSLAAQGGGMALGHLVLPGIGAAVAIGVSSFMAHSNANQLEKECEHLKSVNGQNSKSLVKLNSDLTKMADLQDRLEHEDERLATVLRTVQRQLFRFGYMSHIWRRITFYFRGYYYRQEEFYLIERLDAAVAHFFKAYSRS